MWGVGWGAWSSLKKEKKRQIFDVILTTFMVQGNPRGDQERPLLAIDHLSHQIRHQLVPGRAPQAVHLPRRRTPRLRAP